MGQLARAVFTDFDGTVTVQETFVRLMRQFAPELSAELIPEMHALRVTLREGVRRILESIPSDRWPEMLEFVEGAELRPGFVEFLDFLEEREVPLVIVSGGLTEVIHVILGPLAKRAAGIHAVDVDTSEPTLRVASEFEADDELVSKARVMQRYPAAEQIAVGDSVTDLNMSRHAQLVFARARLQEYLTERQIAFVPFETFFDVRDELQKRW